MIRKIPIRNIRANNSPDSRPNTRDKVANRVIRSPAKSPVSRPNSQGKVVNTVAKSPTKSPARHDRAKIARFFGEPRRRGGVLHLGDPTAREPELGRSI